jgi:hypothetical protein
VRFVSLALAALVGACSRESDAPRDVSVGGGAFTVTLPGGWSVKEEQKGIGSARGAGQSAAERGKATAPEQGFRQALFVPPSARGSCIFTFTKAPEPVRPEVFTEKFVGAVAKGFGATDREPETLTTGIGELHGARFTGTPHAEGAVAFLGSFAGKATVHAFGGAERDTYVGVAITTFAASKEPEDFIAKCRGIAGSLHGVKAAGRLSSPP